MKSVLALLYIGLGAVGAQAQTPIVIRNAVIIDGSGGSPIENGSVVIRGRTIEAVGAAANVVPPPGARVIDAKGSAVMPGLADMHVHLTGGWDGISVDLLSYRRYLNALLFAGVTTVLDVGNVQPYVLQLRQEVAAGRLAGPRIYAAGALLDGADPAWPPISYTVSSVEQVPALVRRQKRDGVDILKAYHGLSLQMIGALAREANKHSLAVIMDNRSVSWDRVVDSGIRAFAHLPAGISNEAVASMKENGVHVITTLAVRERRRRLADLTFVEHPVIRDAWPTFFLDDLRARAAQSDTPDAETLARIDLTMRETKRLFDAGIMLVGGTDAPYPGVFQGESIHHEMELFVEAGLTPLQAISAVTKNAAILMGAGDEWGTLAPGRAADMIVVAGRPDRNVGDSRNIEMVIQQGKVLDRSDLAYDPERDTGFLVGASASSTQ